MHTGLPLFYKVTFSRMWVDLGAVQRQHGPELQLGAAAPLAQIMGTNEDIAKPIGGEDTVLICEDCSCKPVVLAEIAERVATILEETNG